MVRLFCDKCGKEIGEHNCNNIGINIDNEYKLDYRFRGTIQLCNKCKKIFKADMEGFLNGYNYKPC